MKKTLLLSSFLIANLTAATIDQSSLDSDDDMRALKEWLDTKRQIKIKEIGGGSLSLSGEVHIETQATGETSNGVRQRGPGAPPLGSGGSVLPTYTWDIEADLSLDYRTERTWAAIKLKFDNDAGIFSGTFNKIKLDRAYIGGRIVDLGSLTFDIEAGRRKMSNVFDSELEFGSLFDGLLFRFDKVFDNVGDFYINLGAFLIDESNNHVGYVGETGFLDIANTGFYLKYSLIDWDTKGPTSPIDHLRFDFLVSQGTFGYRWLSPWMNQPVVLYAQGLYNHAAERLEITGFHKLNLGGCVGFTIGQLRKQGDWYLVGNYQVLEAQAVPDYDANGIGIGNAADAGFYTTDVDGTGAATTRATAAGNGNYRGFMLGFDYLVTDALTFQQRWQQSITLDKSVGPFRRYKQYEAEFIYAF